MKIGLLCEGSIDERLLTALLERIASARAKCRWPLQIEDSIQRMGIRRGGFGQIPKALTRLKASLRNGELGDFSFFVVVTDQTNQKTSRKIRREISGDNRFVFGVAIQEIEAWWLADRNSTLSWLGLDNAVRPDLRYWGRGYRPERDGDPKNTLDELTQQSPRLDRRYGRGNCDLAVEFAGIWRNTAELNQIELGCPKGFQPFASSFLHAFEHFRRHSVRRRRR